MNQTTNITIEFYGQLKDIFQAQTTELTVPADEPVNVKQLYLSLCEQHPDAPATDHIRPIINDTFVDWDAGFGAGDVVGFFPPASGG